MVNEWKMDGNTFTTKYCIVLCRVTSKDGGTVVPQKALIVENKLFSVAELLHKPKHGRRESPG